MLTNAHRRDNFTAELWVSTITGTDGEGGRIVSWSFSKNINLDVKVTIGNQIECTVSEAIKVDDRLEKVTDRSGLEIYPDGVWVFNDVAPSINAFGYRESYIGRASLEAVSQ